jgi:hypothetical protein
MSRLSVNAELTIDDCRLLIGKLVDLRLLNEFTAS